MNASEMTMRMWYATEGGRKCPRCGRYAKASELGNLSFSGPGLHVTMYGHKDGCKKRKKETP